MLAEAALGIIGHESGFGADLVNAEGAMLDEKFGDAYGYFIEQLSNPDVVDIDTWFGTIKVSELAKELPAEYRRFRK